MTAAVDRESAERLTTLAAMSAEAGAEVLAREASKLVQRMAEGRFFAAAVGQFKRGKSTFLDALIGRTILPAGVVPITTAVTALKHGQSLTAAVRYLDGHQVRLIPTASKTTSRKRGIPRTIMA